MSQKFSAIKKKDSQLIMSTYGRYPLAVKRAHGTRLFDFEGRGYVDLLSGISVCNLGHCRPELADVMAEQARKLVHVSNLFYQEEQLELAKRLLKTCEADKVFFCNSGAEANEGAIKLARRYTHTVKGSDAFEIITLDKSFHGRTLATLTATGQAGPIKYGFDPLPRGFKTIAPTPAALEKAVGDKTCALMIEMVQGEGGVRPLSPEFVAAVEKIRKDTGILVIVDEVQSGLCRTGKFWAHQHFGFKPDIFTSAKGLANGLPMGAVLATDEVARGFEPGSHATTFGGGGVLCAVADKVLQIMTGERLAKRAASTGEKFRKAAEALRQKHPDKIAEVRVFGLMIGIELTFPGADIWKALFEKRFVLNLTQGNVLRLLPPLTIDFVDLKSFLQALDELLEQV